MGNVNAFNVQPTNLKLKSIQHETADSLLDGVLCKWKISSQHINMKFDAKFVYRKYIALFKKKSEPQFPTKKNHSQFKWPQNRNKFSYRYIFSCASFFFCFVD